jgi:hypothetical protein
MCRSHVAVAAGQTAVGLIVRAILRAGRVLMRLGGGVCGCRGAVSG